MYLSTFIPGVIIIMMAIFQTNAQAKNELLNKPAPTFELANQDGETFKLANRRGKGWTVLFFYPKAGTPGCTTQACAFRDSIKVIKDLNAEVYGISIDTVAAQKKFHTKHSLAFDLLADADAEVTKLFSNKMPMVSMAKRRTFIIDSDLVIRHILNDVDPALDSKNVAEAIKSLQK